MKQWNLDDMYLFRTTSVAEHYFTSHKSVQLLQVAWHPGSETDSHMTLLTSDNLLRSIDHLCSYRQNILLKIVIQFQYVFKVKKNVLISKSYKLTILISFSLMHHIHVWSCFFSTYDLREPDVPIHIVTLGDSLQDLTDSPSKTSYRAALGDVAASFDFGPPVELKRKNRFHSTLTSPDVVWPAYIVFGNGDVVIAYTDLSPDPSRLVFFGRFNWQCVCYCLSSLESFNVIICWTKLSKV